MRTKQTRWRTDGASEGIPPAINSRIETGPERNPKVPKLGLSAAYDPARSPVLAFEKCWPETQIRSQRASPAALILVNRKRRK